MDFDTPNVQEEKKAKKNKSPSKSPRKKGQKSVGKKSVRSTSQNSKTTGLAIPSVTNKPPKPTKALPPAQGCSTTPYKSEYDNRDYKYIVLDNGMKVMLIHDPASEKSAASVELQVGSLMDPDDHKGTAKFVQHMLFKGSKKYPKHQ